MGFTGDLFLDVGAYKGRYTFRLADRFKRVVAVEPFESSARALNWQIKDRGLLNVEVLNVAASDRNGTKPFFDFGGEMNSLYSVHPVTGAIKVAAKHQIKTQRLDDLQLANKLDFLKIDTEGHDVQALHGILGKVRSDRPKCQVEIHRDADAVEIKGVFDELKYTYEFIHPNRNVGWILATPI